MAVSAYIFGVIVQVPFIATDLYTGPIAKALDGADVSWVVGLILTSIFYLMGIKIFGIKDHSDKTKN